MLVWYLLYVRHRFVPITVKKLAKMNVEVVVPRLANDVILANLLPEQCASVAFIVGVMGMHLYTTELVRRQNSPEADEHVANAHSGSYSAASI